MKLLPLSIARSLTVCCLLPISFTTMGQDTQPADILADSLARLPYVKRADLDAEGKAIYDMLPGQRPTGDVAGPLAWPAYNPGVAKALLDLHNAAVAAETLDAYTRELAIMVACRETNYHLEWNAHKGAAIRAGIPGSLLDIIRTNQSLHDVSEKDATVIHFGRQLYRDKKVDSVTFANAVKFLGQKGVMDMVAVMNTYAVSGFFAAAVDERVPADEIELD